MSSTFTRLLSGGFNSCSSLCLLGCAIAAQRHPQAKMDVRLIIQLQAGSLQAEKLDAGCIAACVPIEANDVHLSKLLVGIVMVRSFASQLSSHSLRNRSLFAS